MQSPIGDRMEISLKNTFGQSISVTLFGESHGAKIGAVIDGLAPGIEIDYAYIENKLELRRPYGNISTKRQEKDRFEIVSGAFNGFTTGTPLTILIENADTKSRDYEALRDTPRPSHADLTARMKYHGFEDYRGGGHFSGRITAALVAAGAIVSSALLKKGITIGSHIARLGKICDRGFDNHKDDIEKLSQRKFAVLDDSAGDEMMALIEECAKEGDSVGGVLESAIIGVPAGVGEPFFDSMESCISHILFSIPGIKAVSFGAGFGFADMTGSEANDAFFTDGEKIFTRTNNNGGINGGITNGMPIIVSCAVKPTPSIYKEQESVSLSKMENCNLKLSGRHDPAIIHRVRAVADAALAIAVADMLSVRFGTDYLTEK